jgi:hypothetical protein
MGALSQEHESLSDTVARANDWISSSAVRVISVESVMMPLIRGDYVYTTFDQIVRVWYENSKPPV